MGGKQYFFKENEVREGRFSLPHEGHDHKYQVMETRTCDLVVEEIHRGNLPANWNLHYFIEPEDTWNLNRDLLAHILMCRDAPPHLERLFPSRSDPEITIAIHVGRIPEVYHPVTLPSLCRVGKRASLIWGTKFTPLILKIADFMAGRHEIEFGDAIQTVTIQVYLLVPKVVEKQQTNEFDIHALAGYFKRSLWRACARYVRQDAESMFIKHSMVEVDEDLGLEGSVIEDGIRLDIDPDSLEPEVLKYIEHPSTVITEKLKALGYRVELRQVQRIRKKLRETIEDAGLEPIPSFADMVAMGREKMDPKELNEPIPITGIFPYPKPDRKGILFEDLPEDKDLPEDEMIEIVRLVHENTKIAENEKI